MRNCYFKRLTIGHRDGVSDYEVLHPQGDHCAIPYEDQRTLQKGEQTECKSKRLGRKTEQQ